MKRRKFGVVLILTGLLLMSGLQTVMASGRTGYLELVGVPANQIAGGYNTKTGLFEADLRNFDGAYVKITYDDMVITGQVLEWQTKDDYLQVRVEAFLKQDNMEIESDLIEYYSDDERMIATGNVSVNTDDANIKAASMIYLREQDRAEFLDNVVVSVDDGVFQGEHFVMYIDKEVMQFYGAFQAEFQR